MGNYYYIDGLVYHCLICGFKTESFMGIQSHIRPHKKFVESMAKRVQQTLF